MAAVAAEVVRVGLIKKSLLFHHWGAVFAIFFFLSGVQAAACAAELTTQLEEEPKYETSQPVKEFHARQSPAREKLRASMTVGVAQGYDSNANLDSPRKDDLFAQETLDMQFEYPMREPSTNWEFGYALTSIKYYEFTDADMFDSNAEIGITHAINEKFVFKTGYLFEYMRYPHDEDGDFLGQEIRCGITHIYSDRVDHALSYTLTLRNYLSRKMLLGSLNQGSDLRLDQRHTIRYDYNIRFYDNIKVKLTNQYAFNDSNDQYLDFYDYTVYKLRTSIIYAFFEKLYSVTSLVFANKQYDDRLSSVNDETQHDKLYIVSATLLYDLADTVSVYMNYSYRENRSNEPLDQYSGSTVSGGFYYSF